MATLTHRAERAVLGALLQDPALLPQIRHLRADDFASALHAEIFTVIRNLRDGLSDATGPVFCAAVADWCTGTGTELLPDMARACPEPSHGAVYARMVQEASLRRDLAAYAERLYEDAGNLHYDERRFTAAAGPGHGADHFPSHLFTVAAAIRAHVKEFDPGTTSPAVHGSPTAEPERAAVHAVTVASATTVASAAWHAVATRPVRGDDRARQEERLLAGLIRHHTHDSEILDWLPAPAFSAGPRREMYETIATLSQAGKPVDELTVDWELARQQTAASLTRDPAGTARDMRDHEYAARLAVLPVDRAAATAIGRTLLDRYLRDPEVLAGRGLRPAGGHAGREPGTHPARPQQTAPNESPPHDHAASTEYRARPQLRPPPEPPPSRGYGNPRPRM